MTINEIVATLRSGVYAVPTAIPVADGTPMVFACSLTASNESPSSIAKLVPSCPADLVAWWSQVSLARLFEDTTYGQWGLVLMDPQQACSASLALQKSRPNDFAPGDLVIGRFLGDSDLLIVRCDENGPDFGRIVAALPLDDRCKWPTIANSFSAFLTQYMRAHGDKYWCGV